MARLDIGDVRQRLAAREPQRISGQHVRGRAAVAAVLRQGQPEAGPEVLLIRRAEHDDDPWSGHMAFPGGRRDEGDTDLFYTVWRETREEVGLDVRGQARLLGELDELDAVAGGRTIGVVITPFVFELLDEPELVPNYEVAEIVWAPLTPLACGRADTTRPYEHAGRQYDLPAYDVQGRVVWGLTYRMLRSFFSLLCDRASG